MATQRAEMRIEQSDARRTRERPDTGWQRLLAVGAGAVVASAIANVVIAGALDRLLQVPAAFTALQPGPVAWTVIGGSTATQASSFLLDR